MGIRRVYLELVDIDNSGKLTLALEFDSFEKCLLYFIGYGSIADKVIMQGSAPMKSKIVHKLYKHLEDAFKRNEKHEPENPIFVFSLSEESEDYHDYIKNRLSKIKRLNENPERHAYNVNDGIQSAINLNRSLKFVRIEKRKGSVNDIFRKSVLSDINSINTKGVNKKEKAKEKLIHEAKNMEVFQSFEFLKILGFSQESNPSFYYHIRRNYLRSNAYANNAFCTFDSIHFKWENIFRLLNSSGVYDVLHKNLENPATLIFHLRICEPLQHIKDIYFQCQTQGEVDELLIWIEKVRTFGKYKVVLKQSPAAIISFIFSTMTENEVGSKSVNKAGEIVAKAIAKDSVDSSFFKKLSRLIDSLEKLKHELFSIERSIKLSDNT